MYALSKRTLSHYVRGECSRRLRLDLYKSDAGRAAAAAPVRDVKRPGLALIVEQGRQFERQKFAELSRAFPGRVVHGAETVYKPGEELAYGKITLEAHLDGCQGGEFLVEAEYPVSSAFIQAHELQDLQNGSAFGVAGVDLEFSRVRPDILHVVPPPGTAREAISPSGDLVGVSPDDPRLGLRIIDVKLSGEPSPSHFAELAYYGMTLAGWLEDTGRSDRFVVLKDAAIWPGTHDASELRRRHRQDLRDGLPASHSAGYVEALEADLETMPAEVVLGRVRQFLRSDMPEAILAPDWQSLAWHVDSGCVGCDYLGYDWSRLAEEASPEEPASGPGRAEETPSYCWEEAGSSKHLSLVTGLTRGACGKLRDQLVRNVRELSKLAPTSSKFEGHQKLRAGRALFRARSEVLEGKLAPRIPEKAGTSAVLPAWSDIRVALSVDYDVGSGLTFAIGYQLTAFVPDQRLQEEGHRAKFRLKVRRDQARVMLVEEKEPAAERQVLVEVMRHLVRDVEDARTEIEAARKRLGQTDKERGAPATLQVFMWDKLVFEHLCRIVGRHLLALLAPSSDKREPRIAPMAWLFPADSVIEDADFTSTDAPVSVVGEAIQALLAADVPHHYSLLGIANAYHPPRRGRADGKLPFRLHPFFHDPLSDQIPSERGHEIWNRRSPFKKVDYQQFRDILKRAVATKLDALMGVTERLTDDLREHLSARAPSVASVFEQTTPLSAVATDGQIIYQHARLMGAADALKVALLMATPAHQREAAFASVRLEHRHTGAHRAEALRLSGLEREADDPRVFAFRMSPRSKQAKIKEGDFDWSLMPENRLDIQHRSVAWMKDTFADLRLATGPAEGRDFRTKLRQACKVDVLRFDRVTGTVVVRAGRNLLPSLVATGIFDLDVDGSQGVFAVLDPLSNDYFLNPRLRPALQAIKVPPLSQSRPLFRDPMLTRLRLPKPRLTASVPAERFIWDADRLAEEASGRSGAVALAAADPAVGLTPKQREAVRASVAGRLSLLWGPPGTGKTRTAVALIKALVAEAVSRNAGLRLAITGPTWVAIDTAARKVPGILEELGPPPSVARLTRETNPAGVAPELRPFLAPDGSEAHLRLKRRLADPASVTIVAGTVQRLATLTEDAERPMSPLFDFMLIDEASQMSVSQAMVAFATLADDACLTVVGDDLQMPPIQPVEPPEGASHLVGSVYDFFRRYRSGEPGASGITPLMLDRSFRSNRAIVEFVRLAGYGPDLVANEPDLRLRLAEAPPPTRPADWPEALGWTEHLATILDPQEPLVAIIHPDQYSSQRNDGEAGLVASLAMSLLGRIMAEREERVLDPVELFREGLGIVTPHRAQQAAIVENLLPLLPSDESRAAMVASVDTVERFQGQERTVMLASFGLGDRDQIGAEEEFLYSLNRFNVIASRAKAKLIVLMSRRLVDHLPRDPDVLRASRLLKHFADGHLRRRMAASLPGLGPCEIKFR